MSPFNWNRMKMSFTLSKNEKEQFENPENDSTNISAKSSSYTVAICAVRSALFGFVLVLYMQLKMSLQNKKIKKTQESAQNPQKGLLLFHRPRDELRSYKMCTHLLTSTKYGVLFPGFSYEVLLFTRGSYSSVLMPL